MKSNTKRAASSRSALLFFIILAAVMQAKGQGLLPGGITVSPANEEIGINPDAHLVISFSTHPILHNDGQIRVYEVSSDKLVDVLDMSIPPGPKNTRTLPPYDAMNYKTLPDKVYSVSDLDTNINHVYQKNYIGGETEADAFHFYPVIIRENRAIISLHNHKLEYNKTYYVQVDAGVFSLEKGDFPGISGKMAWQFTTKMNAPAANLPVYIVSNGGDDFNTIQGAVDFIPGHNTDRKTIFIRNGIYDEIVFFKNKENITFLGEDMDGVILAYANNSVFNARVMSPDPALSYGFHSLRAVLAAQNCNGINVINMTLRSLGEKPAQAEGLLLVGNENIVSQVNIEGSGDALQATGKIYIEDSKIQGYGDNVLGYGAVFFNRCDFVSTYGPHLWVRNTNANHGNVLLDCTLRTLGDVETTIARAPDNKGINYPFAEAVLINCRLEGVRPEGWGQVTAVPDDIHYWEFNSTNETDGKPVDVSRRHPASKQLSTQRDAETIKNYSTPAFVLGGWDPVLQPVILSEPEPSGAENGSNATLRVKVAGLPAPKIQWFKDGKAIVGATHPVYVIQKVTPADSGVYHSEAQNVSGKAFSRRVKLAVQ